MADRRFIEAGFPCYQVGGETRRERDSGLAPPTHRLHVWWARRPLTPSRAAIAASLLPEDTDVEEFIRTLGIEQKYVVIDGQKWILTGDILGLIAKDDSGEYLIVDSKLQARFTKEKQRRKNDIAVISQLKSNIGDESKNSYAIKNWEFLNQEFVTDELVLESKLEVRRQMGNPAWFNELMEVGKSAGVRIPNLYGHNRAYQNDYIPSGAR